jgi:hypothetical protein
MVVMTIAKLVCCILIGVFAGSLATIAVWMLSDAELESIKDALTTIENQG